LKAFSRKLGINFSTKYKTLKNSVKLKFNVALSIVLKFFECFFFIKIYLLKLYNALHLLIIFFNMHSFSQYRKLVGS